MESLAVDRRATAGAGPQRYAELGQAHPTLQWQGSERLAPEQAWPSRLDRERRHLREPGNGPELINDQKFQDFKLHVEFNCGKDANSGVYLRGRYEVQVETESQGEPPSHHTGGLYGFLSPNPEQARSPDTWQTYDITLLGRRVTVVLNGKTVIDNQEIPRHHRRSA